MFRHAAGHVGVRRHLGVERLQLLHDTLEWRAVVRAVGRIQQLLVRADSRELCCRRACVDTDIERALIRSEVAAGYLVLIVARLERRIVGLIREQRKVRLPRLASRRLLRALYAAFEFFHVERLRLIGECRAHGHEVVAVLHVHDVLLI